MDATYKCKDCIFFGEFTTQNVGELTPRVITQCKEPLITLLVHQMPRDFGCNRFKAKA